MQNSIFLYRAYVSICFPSMMIFHIYYFLCVQDIHIFAHTSSSHANIFSTVHLSNNFSLFITTFRVFRFICFIIRAEPLLSSMLYPEGSDKQSLPVVYWYFEHRKASVVIFSTSLQSKPALAIIILFTLPWTTSRSMADFHLSEHLQDSSSL